MANSIGEGRYLFDCQIWHNATQRDNGITIAVEVPSLAALNCTLRDEGLGEWCCTYWKLVDHPSALVSEQPEAA